MSLYAASPCLEAFRLAVKTGVEQTFNVSVNVSVAAEGGGRAFRLSVVPEAGDPGRAEPVAGLQTAPGGRPGAAEGQEHEPSGDSEVERRRAKAETQKLTAILDALATGVTVADSSGRVVFRNRRAREITGMEDGASSLLARTAGAAVFSLDGERVPAAGLPVARLLRGETIEGEEHILQRPDGERRQVITWGSLVAGDSGPLAIVSFQDVTRLRDLEKRREEYLQALSHDLRTPLQVVTANAQMLLIRETDERGRRHAQDILAAGRRIAAMMDDLVTAAGVEYRGTALDMAPIDLAVLLRNLLTELRGAMEVSRVRVNVAPSCPRVAGDARHLARVFVNLIGNALQYSQPGSPVDVSVSAAAGGEVLVSVADRGPGVEPDELPHLFDRYFRGRAARAQGMGLGLFIVKGLVEAHGGRAWAESAAGEGSTFYVTLPALAVSAGEAVES